MNDVIEQALNEIRHERLKRGGHLEKSPENMVELPDVFWNRDFKSWTSSVLYTRGCLAIDPPGEISSRKDDLGLNARVTPIGRQSYYLSLVYDTTWRGVYTNWWFLRFY